MSSVRSGSESVRRTVHVPVLLREVLDWLALEPNLVVVDGTVGAGGHSQHIARTIQSPGRLIGLDRDTSMLSRAAQVVTGEQVVLKQASYQDLDSVLDELGIGLVDRVVLDLGLSSDQLSDANRGFGFQTSAPLDMRFDTTSGTSVADYIASTNLAQLTEVLHEYGEDSRAGAVAKEVLRRHELGSMKTAADLREAVETIHGARHSGSHPATRIFQALRIAVNHELEHLEHFLTDVLPRRLKPGGRAVIITFHSLEDRLVKNAFREVTLWENLTRKPVAPSPSEIRINPRSRSAKLRVAARQPITPDSA